MDTPPGAVSAPAPEVAVNALPLGELAREQPPRGAALNDVEDGVDDLAQVEAGASGRSGRRQPVFDKMLLAVGQVSGVALV